MLSKALLGMLLVLLASKFGLFTRLRRLKPQLDRAVNLTIVLLVVLYLGQLVWWLVKERGQP